MPNFNLSEYETVDSRIKRFYIDNPDGGIDTVLLEAKGDIGSTRWTVRAEVRKQYGDDKPSGSGTATETDGVGPVNRTSALENAETSAVGRALRNLGYFGDKGPSREEMEKVAAMSQQRQDKAPPEPGAKSVPDDVIKKIGAAETLGELQDIYESGITGQWMNLEVRSALSERKTEINSGEEGEQDG